MIYDINDSPSVKEIIIFSIQQILAIVTATIAVPLVVGNGLTASAALFGAGAGTLVYCVFSKFKSPVIVSSNFSFLKSMLVAFAGGVSMSAGMAGLIIGAFFTTVIYAILSFTVKKTGVDFIKKLMPPVVIGPTVAIIGLSLSVNAIRNISLSNVSLSYSKTAIACGLVTMFVTMLCSIYGKKGFNLIPFLIGLLAGFTVALVFSLIGTYCNIDFLQIMNISLFKERLFKNGISISTFFSVPDFIFINALKGIKEIKIEYVIAIFVAYVPVSLVGFAEHIADHQNLSNIIGHDLLTDPGLDKTLMGDGVGSFVGAFFGGCPNTTYGESIACVALTQNASIITILVSSIGCMILSFCTPIMVFFEAIPSCVVGGICIILFGFIGASGFKMIQNVSLDDNRNLFVVSVILICGIGGLKLDFGKVVITDIAMALILGIITNVILHKKNK
ncbi:MAG: hypothetical protein KBT21_05540 [Treponema sp.]|nr:hypothetical protein [Candidatus Treponema merdequi]